MKPDRVVVTRALPGGLPSRLAERADVWVWPENRPIPRDALLEAVASADGLLCMLTEAIDQALLDASPGLRAVSTMAVGVDNIDLEVCRKRGIPVGHTPGVLTETTADTAFLLLLAGARRLVEGVDFVRAGRWGPWNPELLLGHDLHGSVLGVVGLGRIGTAVARRAAGFGMTVLYHNRSRAPALEAALGVEYRSLDALLAEADHVMLLVPLTAETHHMIDAGKLRRMKPTATLVNAGRGPLVDPVALHEALAAGVIASAALDVTEPEPIDQEDPLLRLPNCTIIPHLGSASHGTRRAMAGLAVDNLLAGLAGEPLPARAGS